MTYNFDKNMTYNFDNNMLFLFLNCKTKPVHINWVKHNEKINFNIIY